MAAMASPGEDEKMLQGALARQPWRYRTGGPAIAVALVSLLALAMAPVGWRSGWWRLGVSFDVLLLAAALGVLGAVLAAVALLYMRDAMTRLRIGLLAGALLLGAGFVAVPVRIWLAHRPAIHDITTDTVNPPQVEAALGARQAEDAAPAAYEGQALASVQAAAYPEIAPLVLAEPPAKVYAIALALARTMPRWTILASRPPGPAGEAGRIEASAASFWFGFIDDVVIRITPEGTGSRVDMRSLSRQGKGDLGVNAERVRAYLAALAAAGRE
jgi:uncharacterized protein (DUF1499 family)